MFSSITNMGTNIWEGVKTVAKSPTGATASDNQQSGEVQSDPSASGVENMERPPPPPQEAPVQQVQPTQPAQPAQPIQATEAEVDCVEPQLEQTQHAIKQDLEEVSQKAIQSAKDWGSYLYSFGKAASQTVTKTAIKIKDTVEEKTLIGDFNKEQEKFVNAKQEQKKGSEAAVAPWVGYNEEESMKTQILALSQDKRNFLRNPPAGVQFSFDFESSAPVASTLLQEDINLEKMRFELVPKQVSEEAFWRNYFYRISLIKQSAQLTSLAQQTGIDASSTNSRHSMEHQGKKRETEKEVTFGSSPPEAEFISDAFPDSGITDEELQKEMQQLGMSNTGENDDLPEWERELQAELQEYEVVADGDDDADLENEIMQQIEAETKDS